MTSTYHAPNGYHYISSNHTSPIPDPETLLNEAQFMPAPVANMTGSNAPNQGRETVERDREKDDELESKMNARAEKANNKRDREDGTWTEKKRRSMAGSATKRQKQTAPKTTASGVSLTKKDASKTMTRVSQRGPLPEPSHRSPTFAAATNSIEANDSDAHPSPPVQDRHDTPLRDSPVVADDNISAPPSRQQGAGTPGALLVNQAFFENVLQTWTLQDCREVIAMLQDIAGEKEGEKERREALSGRIRNWHREMASRK